MSNPLTSPSNIPASTPIPRMPDGSPVPRAKLDELRAKAALETLPPEEDLVTTEDRELQGGIYVGPVSTEPKSEPIVVSEINGIAEVIDPGHSVRDDRLADRLQAELAADAQVSTDNPLYDATALGEPRIVPETDVPLTETNNHTAEDRVVTEAALDPNAFTPDGNDFTPHPEGLSSDIESRRVVAGGGEVPAKPQVDTQKSQVAPKPAAKKAPAKRGAAKTTSTPFVYPDTGNAS